MLVIRLFRTGKKNQPSFKIVVIDKRKSATKGPYVEEVGFYNPLTKEKVLKQERVKYWLSVGAKLSPTVHNLLVSEKIIEGKKIPLHKKAKALEENKFSSQSLPPQKGSEKTEKVEETPSVF
ncbi:MAG: 30S ribosomal protein S16 [Patescibacteria group bacterium]|nr:30S ribosomal protein S16 [Patescibacteria group bacterium]